jgi:hypothetical protein
MEAREYYLIIRVKNSIENRRPKIILIDGNTVTFEDLTVCEADAIIWYVIGLFHNGRQE